MNIVLFLGAGFSRAFNLPVMSEFFNTSTTSLLTDDDRSLLVSLQREMRAAASMLEGDERNLEHVLSHSVMSARWEAEGQPSRHASLCDILARVYGQQMPFLDTMKMRDRMARLLGIGKRGWEDWNHSLTVITTNYDVIADYALYQLRLPPKLPFEHRSIGGASNTFYKADNEMAVLCKLHGSINWFKQPDGSVCVDDRVVSGYRNGPNDDWETRVAWPKCCSPDYKAEGTPVLVPPTVLKSPADRVLRNNWDRARDALMHAERICFVGYSFPPSDTHMRYFLGAALAENVQFRQIDVLDPRAGELVQSLRSSTSGFGNTFRIRLNPVEACWEESGFCITH